MIEFNNRTVYECFNNPFSVGSFNPGLNIPPITIDDSPIPNKRSWYTPDTLPSAIYVASGNSVNVFTNPSDYLQLLEPKYDDTDTQHTIISYNHCRAGAKSG